jgi:hypothetical protein
LSKTNLVILIDIGSTHSFIDVVVVKDIKAIVVKITVLTVTITNDSFLRCVYHCPKLTWFIQGYEFQVDLRRLKLL